MEYPHMFINYQFTDKIVKQTFFNHLNPWKPDRQMNVQSPKFTFRSKL